MNPAPTDDHTAKASKHPHLNWIGNEYLPITTTAGDDTNIGRQHSTKLLSSSKSRYIVHHALYMLPISVQGYLPRSEAMTVEFPSLILALVPPSNPELVDNSFSEHRSESSAEYEFTIKLDRIERAPPTFTDTPDGSTGGKVLHGTLVAQNVFEQHQLPAGGQISVACPKRWNLRLLIWRKWCGIEPGTEVHCRGTLTERRSRHNSIHTLATNISGCYPVLGFLGILIALSPIICVLWPIMLLAKVFYPGLILLLIARATFFIWPTLMPNVEQFDIFFLIFVLFGGFLKFYWWAVNLQSADHLGEQSDATQPDPERRNL